MRMGKLATITRSRAGFLSTLSMLLVFLSLLCLCLLSGMSQLAVCQSDLSGYLVTGNHGQATEQPQETDQRHHSVTGPPAKPLGHNVV